MMNLDITKTGEDFINEYYTAYFQGQPITFIQNKFTGEIHIDADQAVRAFGFDGSIMDYLGTDEGLGMISEWKKDHPDIPFFGNAVIKPFQPNDNFSFYLNRPCLR